MREWQLLSVSIVNLNTSGGGVTGNSAHRFGHGRGAVRSYGDLRRQVRHYRN